MNRNREYTGPDHTLDGIRGKTEVRGITFRDLKDCLAQAILASTGEAEFSDKTVEIDDEFKDTEYEYKGDWTFNDLYKVDLNKLDPLAIAQNLGCFVEHYMGIYPNIKI